jgi:isopentenyl-diphosphate delta-isomerase
MTDPNQERVVYVDQNGQPTGETAPKLEAHHGNTRLHSAFSCYIFNDKGQFLVTQRASIKKVWPNVWTNSVCGHPAPGESRDDAVIRRTDYELGMQITDLQVVLPKYIYKTPPYNGIIEHEFCPVYVAVATTQPNPNAEEVDNFEWLDWQEFVEKAQADTKDEWSWWCKDQLKQLEQSELFAAFRARFS